MPGSALAFVVSLVLLSGLSPAAAQTPSPAQTPAPAPTSPTPPPSSPTPPPSTPTTPAPPTNAADAADRLDVVQRDAEVLTEQWHAAQDTLETREAQVVTLRAAVPPAKSAVAEAQANEEKYRKQVDAVAMATFESGNLDQFNALLASGSAQDFLDQMSALETISSEYRDALLKLSAVIDKTSAAQGDADAAVDRAQAAVAQATKAEQDLEARKRDAEIRIDEAEALLDQLSPSQRRQRNGPVVVAPLITGTGVGVDALRAAAAQLGQPYQWGAEGPGSFDCSGLVSWAYKRAGVTLPRSSSQQARIGRPVSWDQLQPGDLVFYYRPVSHVGIYAGDGIFVDAPQTGDVVRYQRVSRSAFSGARRL